MKKIILAILILTSVFSLCACGGTEAAEPLKFSDDPSAIAVASESVVMLNCYDKKGELYCTGSAFQCFEDGVYVTNYHVIEGVDKIQGCTEKKLYFDIDEVIAADPDRDIAILKTSADPGVAILPDGDSDALIKGENVVAIGSPKGFLNTVSKGTYSGVAEFDDGQKLLQFNASVSSGSSGGALFNDKGEVIGVTSSQYNEGDDLNFAVPMNDVTQIWIHKDEISNEKNGTDAIEMSLSDYRHSFDNISGERIKITAYVSSMVCAMGYYEGVFCIRYSCFFVDNQEDVCGYDICGHKEEIKYNGEYQHEVDRELLVDGTSEIEFEFLGDINPGDLAVIEFDSLKSEDSQYTWKRNGVNGKLIEVIK